MRSTIQPRASARAVLAVAGGLLLLAASASAGLAATKTTITIDVNVVAGTEMFVTSGGALCEKGTAVSFDFRGAGGGQAGTFHLQKTLTCDDDTGTFTIAVNAATAHGSPTDQGGWSVVGGTGAYVGLHGGGNLVGTYTDTGIIDQYTGVVSN
jgi:hypothetical protein